MTTLIAVYNSEGCVGRCDSKCYNAHEPKCECICRGRNHGAGYRKALDNTRELAREWIREYAQDHDLDHYLTEIGQDVLQLPLW